ncbi:MAG: J domain-containing protein [Bacteroidales bacterium]
MATASSYTVLGLKSGASGKEIRAAYRKLAKRYHPDINSTPEAARKFQEIKNAYEDLTKIEEVPYGYAKKETGTEDLRRTVREKARAWERRRESRERQAEEEFRKSGLYDLLLLLNYLLHGVIVLFSLVAVILPVILALFVDPVIFVATFYFVILGIFLIWHIYKRRKTWFRLGTLNTSRNSFFSLFRKPVAHDSNVYCCYSSQSKADGKPYTIRLIRTENIRVFSRGIMDHRATYTNNAKKLVIPRSARAEYIHRISSITKILLILAIIAFLPVTSVYWRLVTGLVVASLISFLILQISRVKSKTSYLMTPALIIKLTVWSLVILAISETGPGPDLTLNSYKFIVFAGLFFLLDMVFDLLLGFFPFYQKLFIPVVPQGKILSRLYQDGFRNYMEYPFYSILFPLYKWIF